MPSTYAHYRFGQDVLKVLPTKYRNSLSQEEDLFNIGLHGPDLLYYYKPFSHHPLHAEGNRMHHLTGREFFTEASDIFLSHRSPIADYAYLCGYLCHYALDRACHGYINNLAANGQVSHEEIESEFDRTLLEEDHIDPIRTNLASHIHASRRAAKVISPYIKGATTKEIYSGIRSLWGFNLLLTMPGRIGYRQVDSLLKHLPAYPMIHGHMINIDPNPLCAQSNIDLRQRYKDAIEDARFLLRVFLPALKQEKPWPSLIDYDFLSMPAESCMEKTAETQ